MENTGPHRDLITFLTKRPELKRTSRSNVNYHKALSKTERKVSLNNKSLNTIETDIPAARKKMNSDNWRSKLPQLTIPKGVKNYRTIETSDCSKRPCGNRAQNRLDQFDEIFPRKASDLEPKYSVTEPEQLKYSIKGSIRRWNHPKILRSRFPFGEEVAVRKPFSQQLKKRCILESRNPNRKSEENSNRNFQQQGLFTFYPREAPNEMINQFLQIQ